MTLLRITHGSICCGFVAHKDSILEAAPWIWWFIRTRKIAGAHELVRRLRSEGAEVKRIVEETAQA